jgi:hypothetical protein
MIYVDSDMGRIGPFWWVNGIQCRMTLISATYNGSLHFVWRPGFWGWDGMYSPKTFKWLIIKP